MASTTQSTGNKRRLRRYIIARHGETNFNKERRVQGSLDAPCVLTPDGFSQAAALGAYVASRQAGEETDDDDPRRDAGTGAASVAPPITRTWCSPLTRCRQTYAAVSGEGRPAPARPLPDPTIRADLREMEFREWEGRLREEVVERDSEKWNAFTRNPKALRLDDGGFAPVLDCWERGLGNWAAIRSDAATPAKDSSGSEGKSKGDDRMLVIFIMCHGAIGQCMLLQALGLDVDMFGKGRRYSFDNCECVEVEWADDDDGDDGGDRSRRWRRVHPAPAGWESAAASRGMASGAGLACAR